MFYQNIDEPDPTAEANLLEAQANYFVNACCNVQTPAPRLEDHVLLSHLDQAICMPSLQDWPLRCVKCKVMIPPNIFSHNFLLARL